MEEKVQEYRQEKEPEGKPLRELKRKSSWQETSLAGQIKKIHLTPNGIPQEEKDADTLVQVLRILVGFNTTSSHEPTKCRSNVELVSEVKRVFEGFGAEIRSTETEYPSGVMQGSLVVRIGPEKPGGILFCDHTDVIPADPEGWLNGDPFKLNEDTNLLYGRGTVDTKVNIASSLLVADFILKTKESLEKPVYFAFSWGEEIGCMGTEDITKLLEELKATPELIVVGEATEGKIVTGHKGGMNLNITIKGIGGHSSQPEMGINPIYPAGSVIGFIEQLNEKFQSNEQYQDKAFDPPYPIVNPGYVNGGTTANAIPDTCRLHVHIRPTPQLDTKEIVVNPVKEFLQSQQFKMKKKAQEIAEKKGMREAEEVSARCEELSYSHPLAVQPETPLLTKVVNVHRRVTEEEKSVVTASFCSEAGSLYKWAKKWQPDNIPLVIVNGPGHMTKNNAHKPNEFITRQQLTGSMRLPLALVKELCFSQEKEAGVKGEEETPGTVAIPTEPAITLEITHDGKGTYKEVGL